MHESASGKASGSSSGRGPAPLLLAYVGDAVHELYVRTALLQDPAWPERVDRLHKAVVEHVNATAQAAGLRAVDDLLTEEERDVVRRGRNTKGSVPRGADPVTYRYSTGFEALVGHLYLKGDFERLGRLLELALAAQRQDPEEAGS